MPFLSIIIPVYNAGVFLPQLLESLQKQTFSDFEAIFVDDGSSDNSAEIIRKYAADDWRIKLVSQRNSGLCLARNKGIEHASGKYLTFLDHDDWVSSDYYQNLCRPAQKNGYDVVANNNIVLVIADRRKYVYPRSSRLLKGEYAVDKRIINKKSGRVYVWNKIYGTEFIRRNNLLFFEDNILNEDVYFTQCAVALCKKIYFVNEGCYYHRKISSSVSAKFLNANIRGDDYLLSFERIWNFYRENGLADKFCPPFSLLKAHLKYKSPVAAEKKKVFALLEKMSIPQKLVPFKYRWFYLCFKAAVIRQKTE